MVSLGVFKSHLQEDFGHGQHWQLSDVDLVPFSLYQLNNVFLLQGADAHMQKLVPNVVGNTHCYSCCVLASNSTLLLICMKFLRCFQLKCQIGPLECYSSTTMHLFGSWIRCYLVKIPLLFRSWPPIATLSQTLWAALTKLHKRAGS